jgi:hypothetical protein
MILNSLVPRSDLKQTQTLSSKTLALILLEANPLRHYVTDFLYFVPSQAYCFVLC